MPQAVIVVPCYNEAARLDAAEFLNFLSRTTDIVLLFVNDGSTDETLGTLLQLHDQSPRQILIHDLPNNVGKAEAVRQGMIEAFEHGADYAGYWDADLATPLEEIERFIQTLDGQPDIHLVMGTRVRLLGRHIERKVTRHFLGRAFATVASLVLRLPVYDTQCGAKLFRVEPATRELFQQRFCSRWIFDVELLARMQAQTRLGLLPPAEEIVYECPLARWQDVAGSKLNSADFLRALLELVAIQRKYRPGRSPKPPADIPAPQIHDFPASNSSDRREAA